MNDEQLIRLIRELAALSKETEWVEFKHNNANPDEIGKYISALSNSTALCEKEAGYIVWGIEDGTHELVGTKFKPHETKKGNEDLENWLATQLNPKDGFEIYEIELDEKCFVIFKINPATSLPVGFKGERYIRIGSYTKKLSEHQDKEKQLWALFDRKPFEEGIAAGNVSSDDVLRLIDYPSYFDITEQSLPDNRKGILDKLISERFIIDKSGDFYNITNLGAILFAKELKEFRNLARKRLRIVFYEGNNKISTRLDNEVQHGYAIRFEDMINYITDRLPQKEVINGALREKITMFPEIAIRELVANALIHQDFSITGTGPKVEVFDNRIEITNPGKPLIDTKRFVDFPPQTRNDKLASFMRRIGICEEMGTGIDKVLVQVELSQLPAPDLRDFPDYMQVVLYAHKEFSEMGMDEKIWACYLHACLQRVSNKTLTNSSLRERFGLPKEKSAQISKVIKSACEDLLIKQVETSTTSRRYSNYLPYWA